MEAGNAEAGASLLHPSVQTEEEESSVAVHRMTRARTLLRILWKSSSVLLGPFVGVCIIAFNPFSDIRQGRMLAVLCWTVLWWVLEAAPLGVTALTPAVLFPPLGIMGRDEVARSYMNDENMLILGSLFLGHAIKLHGIDRRIMLLALSHSGGSIYIVVALMMSLVYFLSWWMSNTATCACMMPVVVALVSELDGLAKAPDETTAELADLKEAQENVSRHGQSPHAVLRILVPLGVAYSSSVGGMATLTGTGPNVVFSGQRSDISWFDWFALGVPVSLSMQVLLVVFVCAALRYYSPPDGWQVPQTVFDRMKREHSEQQRMSTAQLSTTIIFGLVTLSWFTRDGFFGWEGWVGYQSWPEDESTSNSSVVNAEKLITGNGTVALMGVLLLFLLPTKWQYADGNGFGGRERLLPKSAIQDVSWTVVCVFENDDAPRQSSFDRGTLTNVSYYAGFSWGGALLSQPVTGSITELMSNTATASIFLPIFSSVAPQIGADPLALMVPAVIACSCAFILPTSTPPNAIAYGTGFMKITDMIKFGFGLNLFGGLLSWALVRSLGPVVFGYSG